MATKMKGFFKGFKYISQIFVYKEHEMEIGYPTDVRHVAHIGWDSSPLNAPSWMNEFKTASDFSATSFSNFGQPREITWPSQGTSSGGFDQARGLSAATAFGDTGDAPKVPKKTKRKKSKLQSQTSRSSSRSSKSRATFATGLGEAGAVPNESG